MALLVTVIPLTLFQIISAQRTTATMVESVADALKAQSVLMTREISRFIKQRITDSVAIAQADVFKTGNYQNIVSYIQSITELNKSIEIINVINNEGIIKISSVDSSQEGYLAWDVNLGIKEIFLSALKAGMGAVYISEAHLLKDVPEIIFLTPIIEQSSENPALILLVKYNMSGIKEIVSDFNEYHLGDKHTYIVDKLGKIILSTNPNSRFFETLPDTRVHPAMLSDSDSGSIYYSNNGNTEVITGYADMPESGANSALNWSIVTITSKNEILLPTYETTNVLTFIGILVAAITVFIAYLFARSISLPLQRTAALAEEIRSGNYSHRLEANFGGELGSLATAINEMADQVEERTAEIVKRNEKLTSEIVERTRTQDRLKMLSHKIVRMQEEERRRVSRELHDGINQLLVSVKYKIESFADKFTETGETAFDDIGKALMFLEEAISEVRRVSHDLRPTVLDDLGLGPAISNLTRQFSERNQIDVEISGGETEVFDRLPVDVETAMYRIVQEALMNIEKHANATSVVIHMTHTDNDVTIRIEDNGEGFSVQQAARKSSPTEGMGLRNMRERIELLQGTFFIHSDPGKGTFLEVKAPLKLE